MNQPIQQVPSPSSAARRTRCSPAIPQSSWYIARSFTAFAASVALPRRAHSAMSTGARAAKRVAEKMPEKLARATLSRTAGSFTTTNRQGWEFSAEGACRADSRMERMASSGTGRSA